MFPLIFQFPLNVLCSYKALINSTCNSGLYRIYKHSYFLFFQLITYHWPFVSYQNICIFIKWKHVKYHAERSKYPFHLGVETFSYQPKVKGTCISKKVYPALKFHPRVNFTSPTCNMPLTEKKQVLYMNYNLLYHGINMYLNTCEYIQDMTLFENVETPAQSPVYLLQKWKVHPQLLL